MGAMVAVSDVIKMHCIVIVQQDLRVGTGQRFGHGYLRVDLGYMVAGEVQVSESRGEAAW